MHRPPFVNPLRERLLMPAAGPRRLLQEAPGGTRHSESLPHHTVLGGTGLSRKSCQRMRLAHAIPHDEDVVKNGGSAANSQPVKTPQLSSGTTASGASSFLASGPFAIECRRLRHWKEGGTSGGCASEPAPGERGPCHGE